jgi:membrane protein YdbS with pleckstrin-like domain
LFTAVFLSVVLCFWTFGIVSYLPLLVRGARALLVAVQEAPAPPQGGALAMGVFVLVFLTIMTIASLSVLRLLLSCFVSEDRLELRTGELLLLRRMGPFRRQRRLPRSAIRNLRIAEHSGRGGALVADLDDRTLSLSDLGTVEERREAARQLQEALGPTAAAVQSLEPRLPRGWVCLSPSLGQPLLVPEPGMRRRQALVMAAVTLVLLLVCAQLLQTALARPSFWPLTLMVAVPTAAAVWGTLWLALGRMEWRLESRRIVLQRRFGGELRERFEARALELTRSIDSDGDHWYDLMATDLRPAGGGGGSGGGGGGGSGGGKIPASHSLLRRIHDPAEPLQLGRWLAHRCPIPFDDGISSLEGKPAPPPPDEGP